MRLLYILISFGLLISSSFSYSQDYSKSVTRFRFNSKFDSIQKEHVFTYKLPTDGYSFQISLDSKVVPIAMFVKYSDLEVWTGFVGQRSNDAYKQEELSLEEKKRLLKIQSPSTRSLIESQIESSLPDPKKISGGIEGGKYLVKDKNGTDLVTFKKVGADLFNFRSKLNVPLLGNQPSENPIFFKEDYIKDIYKELNIDPSKQSLIITEGRERDHIDNGTCVLVDKPAEFYLDYFSEMNFQNRNFIGELIFYKENYGLIENINSAIRGVGGKEIISIFQNGDDNAVKATEKIVGGSVFFTDGSSYGEILSSENSFTFNKKGKLDGITIIVFTPLEESSFVINLKQIPEGLNQIFYKSGQLEEEYNIQYGKLNGEKISYYEDKNYKVGQDNKPIKEITTYFNGSKTGVHKEYDLNQNMVLEENLKDGIRNGKYKKFVNGKIIEQGSYVNNEKEGEWTTLSASEKITQNYAKGKLNGAYIKYNNDILVERGQYLDGIKSGEWEKYTNDGKLISQSVFLNDNLNGVFKKYNIRRTLDPNIFEGGNVISEEGFYLNGVMNGVWTYRYDDGRIKAKGIFKNGDGTGFSKESHGLPTSGREGLWLFYYYSMNEFDELTNLMNQEKGDPPIDNNEIEIQEKSNWINGSCEGKTIHSIAGKNRIEIDYLKGLRNGKFIVYSENGKKKLETTFANGTIEFEGNYLYKPDEKFDFKNGKWEEQLTPEERFARMQKQVEEMNEKADKLAERIKNQADKINTKLPATGKIKEVYNGSRGKPGDIKVRTTCCECNNSCFNAVYSDFVIGWDDDPIEFECHSCHQKYILKFTQIQRLFKGDDF